MAWRKAHGSAAARGSGPRIETHPIDELPAGVPAPAPPESPADRGTSGRFAQGNALARRGGQSRAGQTRLAARLGLGPLATEAAFAPYKRSAVSYRRAKCTDLARTVGGGVCGPGPSSIVASAALALAWSRYLSDVAASSGNVDLAMRAAQLGVIARQHEIAAHDLCAKEAEARAADAPPAHAALFALGQALPPSGSP